MNKRIKLKKGILHKKCDDNCPMHKTIVENMFITCNGCMGCKHRSIAENMCEENEKIWDSMTYDEKLEYSERKSLKDIEKLSSKKFANRVKERFYPTHHKYNFNEYLRILSAVRRILITQTNDEELIIQHMISEVNRMFYK